MFVQNKFKIYFLLIVVVSICGCTTNKEWYSNEYSNGEIKQIVYKCNRDAQLATSGNTLGSINARWALIGAIVGANEESSLFEECVKAFNLSPEPLNTQVELEVKQSFKNNKSVINRGSSSGYEELIVGTWVNTTNNITSKTTYFPNKTLIEVAKANLPNGGFKVFILGGKWEVEEKLLTIKVTSSSEPKLMPIGLKLSMEILFIDNVEIHLKDFMNNKRIVSNKITTKD